MQTGEGELHLGLDAGRPDDLASLCSCRQVPQEGGLTDARLAAENQHVTLTGADTRDKAIEHAALADAVEQTGRSRVGIEHAAGIMPREQNGA